MAAIPALNASKTLLATWIDLTNLLVSSGAIVSVSGTVTTALADVATERDAH